MTWFFKEIVPFMMNWTTDYMARLGNEIVPFYD